MEIPAALSVDPALNRKLRRNFILLFMDFALFGAAMSLIGSTTVVPDFVSRLTNSDTLIGLAGSSYAFAWLIPQLVFAQYITRRARRKPFVTWAVMPFRLIMAVIAVAIGATAAENHTAILAIFMTGYILFAVGDGLITVVWADLIGGMVPERWRGVLFGGGQVVVAIATLGTRAVVEHMLGPSGPAFPQNYAQMFGIAAAIFLCAGACLMLLVETPTTLAKQTGPTLNQYLPYLGNVLRTDRAFQRFTLTRSLIDLTAICAPFYIIFGTNYLKLPSATLVGDSVLLATAGSALGAVMMGWLSHHSGSRAVIGLCGLASCLHPALGLLSYSLGQPALYGALFLLGFVTSATIPGYFDWIITHAPPDHRPIYVGLTNTISAMSHLAPFVGGLLLSLTESNFSILFGMGGLLGLLGTISVVFLAEPRRRSVAVQT